MNNEYGTTKDYLALKNDIIETCNITKLSEDKVAEYLKEGVCHSQLCAGSWFFGKFIPKDFTETLNEKRIQRTRKILH